MTRNTRSIWQPTTQRILVRAAHRSVVIFLCNGLLDVWRHGDFIARNPRTRGYIIYGRSDGVLNPSGVRFGSGEIYSALERFGSVVDDSICVGQRRPQDAHERVLLFVKMRDGHKLTPSLKTEMSEAIKVALSARHVPSFIFSVDEIPVSIGFQMGQQVAAKY